MSGTCPAEHLFGVAQFDIGTSSGAGQSAGTMTLPASDQVPGGWLGPLADLLTGGAVLTVADGRACPTVNLRLDVSGPLPSAGTLTGFGSVVGRTADLVLATADLHDQHGRIAATATGRFVLAGQPHTPSVAARPASLQSRGLSLDTGLGISPTPAPEGEVEVGVEDVTHVQVPLRPELANPYGSVHGGVQLALAEVAARQHLRTSTPGAADTAGTPELLDMTIEFGTPSRSDGDPLVLTAQTVRRGRTIAAVAVDLAQGGRVVSRARATYLLT